MDKRKVIFDVDTGSDDAVALIVGLANPQFDVLGICTVNGNRAVPVTTENTLRIVELMGNKVPVYRGAEMPIISVSMGLRPGYPAYEPMANSGNIHGMYIDSCPKATIKEQEKDAVSWLIETLMAAGDKEVTLIPLGPITNLGLALRAQPKIAGKIKEIMFMGGGYKIGNKSPVAEMNVWMDPEACQIVLEACIPFTFVPLDATHQAYMTMADAKRIRAIGSRPADVVADLVEQRIFGYSTWQKVDSEEEAAPVHDPLCVAALVDPTVLLEVEDAPCEIDLGHANSYGQTIFDIRNGRMQTKPINCKVALSADREKFVDIIIKLLEYTR